MGKPTLIFDQDGTLSRCAEYYVAVQHEFAELKHRSTGIPTATALKVLESIDLAATALPDAFRRDRFPTSFSAASVAIDRIMHRETDDAEAAAAFLIGDAVFEAPYALYEGVYEMLQQYKAGGWQLALVTKGDWGVQWSKIMKNRLNEIFGDNIFVVMQKDLGVFQQVITELDVDIETSVMVGDSLKDDIGPAKAAGLATVHVVHSTQWSYDHADDVSDWQVETVTDLPDRIPVSVATAAGV
jgi:putative hydrolase of the HAD superfamily